MQTKPLILALLAGVAVSGAAQAALFDRGGGLIYDDVLNITWLQNANLAATNTFGVSGIDASSGRMNWNTADSWIAAMNTAEYLGYDDWRLPTLGPVNGAAFNYNYSTNGSTDVGYNITSSNSEMSYMYYVNLGLTVVYNPDGSWNPNPNWGIFGNGTSGGQNDVGLIDNLQSFEYWSGLEYAPVTNFAWFFNANNGTQFANGKSLNYYAWAVRPGDVAAPIPEPETYALLLAGLGLVGWAARRRRG